MPRTDFTAGPGGLPHAALLLALAVVPGCDRGAAPDAGAAAEEEADRLPTNRVAIPAPVRRNLGITFVDVDARHVEQTIRVPGRFELRPLARREYRTMLPGRVELRVDQFDRVEVGTPLYEIDSPAWRDLQRRLSEADANITRLEARVGTFEPLFAAHARHEHSLDQAVRIWSDRVEQLEAVREAGGGRLEELAAARAQLARTEAEFADVQEKDAELEARRAEASAALDAARAQQDFLLESAAAILGVDPAMLSQVDPETGAAGWRSIERIVVTAEEAGVVESLGLTNGAWADEKTSVVRVVQPDRLRFHAQGLQSDLGRLSSGLPVRIVAPTPTRETGAIDLQDVMTGTLELGLGGDPADRTIDLYVVPDGLADWARPGVSAQLEIVTDATARPALAVPLAAVQRDGLERVLFRRDPADPDGAIRIDADLGVDDGRWIVVRSGLARGDEVVLDGAFQLMLATSGGVQQGGHFHADGTFHAEDH